MALAELICGVLAQPVSWLYIVVALLTLYVFNWWQQVRRLPPGPTALPFIGNILQLRGPKPLYEKAYEWGRRYGDPFTVWVGPRPIVITGTKEGFKEVSGPLRNIVAGRMQSNIGDLQARGFADIIFSDFDPAWDVLRRLAHVAIRKYAQTDKLAELVAKTTDIEVEDSLQKKDEAENEIVGYIEGIVNNILGVSTFGETFTKGDPDYETLKNAAKHFEEEGQNGLPSDILPILGWIFYKKENSIRNILNESIQVTDKMFAHAKSSWVPGSSRHFTDALLNAREQFVAEDRASGKYLTDENLRQAIFDIFGAGTGTSKSILGFSFLHLADDQKLQDELRAEVLDEIGSRTCLQTDRPRLAKVDSFLQEIIRFHPVVPLNVPRKALSDTVINGRSIPKGTGLLMNLYKVNRDIDIWGPDADKFKPLRFIDASKDQIARGLNSFGMGARSCPGEKMAQADMFYTIVRTLQKVKLSVPKGKDRVNLGSLDSDIQIEPIRQNVLFTRL